VTGCGSGFIGPTTIAFTQALNPPRNSARSRNRHGTWTGGKQRIAVDADQFFDIGSGSGAGGSVLGCRRIFGTKVAYWSATPHPANSAIAQASTLIAIFIAGMGREPWSAGWTASLLPNAAFFVSGQPGRELR
jgi:hypothetical protein